MNGHELPWLLQDALQLRCASNATTLVLTRCWTFYASGVNCHPPVAPCQCRAPDIGFQGQIVTASVMHEHPVFNSRRAAANAPTRRASRGVKARPAAGSVYASGTAPCHGA